MQSFADGRLGCGTIYKASNFKYFGCDTSIFWEHLDGSVLHNSPMTNTHNRSGYIRNNTEYLNGHYKSFRVKTYRYIYPFDKSFEFKYPEKPYPAYDKGFEYIEVKRDIEKIKSNIQKLQSAA